MTPEDDGLWLSKPDAAALLGVATRQIERREAAGQLRKRTLPRAPGETSARVVYSRADLLALKAGTPNEYDADNGRATDGQRTGNGLPTFETNALAIRNSVMDELFRNYFAAREPAAPPAPAKPWLTLSEAAEASGLPAAWLVKNAEYVQALDLGTHTRGGRWRFRLDALANIGR